MRTAVKRFVLLSFLALLLILPTSLLADEKDAKGTIGGRLINGTTGGQVLGAELVLKKYEGDEERENQKTLSNSQGKFSFSGLEPGEKFTYFVHSLYKGVEYYSPPIVFEGEKREIPLEITVYDTTESDKMVSVVMHHVLLEPKEGALWVRELMILENNDNKVYVGAQEIAPDKKETLRISLPPQAQELQVLRGLMSCCIVQTQDGFADTMDIKPGRKEVQFRYKVDYRSSSLSLPKKINLTTGSLDFFIPNRGIKAAGENIQYAGLLGEPEQQFLHFTGKKLAKGMQVALSLESLPTGKITFKGIAPILGGTLFLLGLAYPLIRRVKKSRETEVVAEEEPTAGSGLQEQRQRILSAIAELDDALDSGQISQEEHAKKRRVLKERVVELTKTLKSTNSPL